jgi:ammonia channel protein AmtB
MNGIWNSSAGVKAIDFAGGTVVHMTSGWSAFILCLIVGPRLGFKNDPMPPHSMVLCMIGTGMLWVGWYGFNAGTAVAADVIAANAFTTTTITTATAAFTWGSCIERAHRIASNPGGRDSRAGSVRTRRGGLYRVVTIAQICIVVESLCIKPQTAGRGFVCV